MNNRQIKQALKEVIKEVIIETLQISRQNNRSCVGRDCLDAYLWIPASVLGKNLSDSDRSALLAAIAARDFSSPDDDPAIQVKCRIRGLQHSTSRDEYVDDSGIPYTHGSGKEVLEGWSGNITILEDAIVSEFSKLPILRSGDVIQFSEIQDAKSDTGAVENEKIIERAFAEKLLNNVGD